MNPTEACRLAAEHHIAGRLDQAQWFCEQILFDLPDHSDTLHLLGLILLDRGDPEAGLLKLAEAVTAAPERAAFHNSLGEGLRATSHLQDAVTAFESALAIEPQLGAAWCNLGLTHLAQGALTEATGAFENAIRFTRRAPEPHLGLGHTLRRRGNLQGALRAYERAARIGPSCAEAWMSLSACHEALGRPTQAHLAAQKAIAARPLSRRPARRSGASRVLVLHSAYDRLFTFAEEGAVRVRRPTNLPQHLSSDHFEILDLYVEHLDLRRHAQALEQVDLIYNSICDPDYAPEALAAVARLAKRLGRPILNTPEAVLACSRDGNARRFAASDTVVFPMTVRLSSPTVERALSAMASGGLRFPVILRQSGTHMGGTMQLASKDLSGGLPEVGERELFITQFVEHRPPKSSGRLARKMRVWVVGGALYPFMCTFSPSWRIHGGDRVREMRDRPDLQAEERRYLEDPEAYLGAEALAALHAMAALIPLDVFGIDFTQLEDGRLLIFEANAAMAINPARAKDFPYLAPYAQVILEAVEALVSRTMDRA